VKRKGVHGEAEEHESAGESADARPPSRTSLKKASERLQDLGAELVDAKASLLAGLALPESLRDAIRDAKAMSSFGAKRRQLQFIGKQMRALDDETVESIRTALGRVHSQSAEDTKLLHEAERWRDALIDDDERLSEWVERYPGGDLQSLRALIRQARKDARQPKAGAAERQGRAYREIFAIVRAQLKARENAT
jgi:ribosome-associated protein